MKKILAIILTVITITGLMPNSSRADNNDAAKALDIAELGLYAAAVVGLAVIEISDAVSCARYGYNCTYYSPSTRCGYLQVTTDEQRTSCQQGHYGGYRCVTIKEHSSTFIEKCNM